MRNFYKLAEGVNTTPLLDAVVRNPQLWNEHKIRTTHPQSPHAQVDDILLRFQDISGYKDEAGEYDVTKAVSIVDGHESMCYFGWFYLYQCQAIIFDLMRRVEGIRLGRVMITRLAPGKVITPHADQGSCAEYYDRYHVMLKNNPGSIFRCGQETVTMKPGEVWYFDNKIEHEVVNNSVDDRITMIVDIRSVRG